MLYDRNWDKQRIIDLFNIIDWMMQIPASLQSQLMHDIENLERSRGMTYMNSFERRGLERGRQEGIQEGLQEGIQEGIQEGRQKALRELVSAQLAKRFGELPTSITDRMALATAGELQAWGEAMLCAVAGGPG